MAAKNVVVTSISMSRQLSLRLSQRLPRHGDRSKLIARLIEMFLDGQIVVAIPERKF